MENIKSQKINIQQDKTPFIYVIIGDVVNALKAIPDESIDCVVTSPPYWKQRDYGVENQIGQENSYDEYIEKLVRVFSEMRRIMKRTGTFFLNIGYKYLNKELLLIPELLAIELQKNGWTLLNKIIWAKPNAMPSSVNTRFGNVYEPIFLFVKKESKYVYYLNVDKLREKSNVGNDDLMEVQEFLGMRVYNSILKGKSEEGFIEEITTNDNKIIAKVVWNDGSISFEPINSPNEEGQQNVVMFCPNCKLKIESQIDFERHTKCEGFPVPLLPDKEERNIFADPKVEYLFPEINNKMNERKYNGKFLLAPNNRGASPGARKSLFGEYFVVQRKYKIYQHIVAKYLRYWKEKTGVTIEQIDKIFGYKDTASHWFRLDYGSWGKGGSIPSPSDWQKLKDILGFDEIYDRWLTETHLVLQTVRPHPKGRNPGDLWEIKLQKVSDAHFATFPEELVRRCILAGSPEGGIVLDPFAGSGTTGKVALENNRSAILIDIVPTYLDIMKKRCKQLDKVFYVE